jgi:hypothetical protein
VHWLVYTTFSDWSLVSTWRFSIAFLIRNGFFRLFIAVFWWFRYKFSCFLC